MHPGSKLLVLVATCLTLCSAHATATLQDEVAALEPVIGTYPPHLETKQARVAALRRYKAVKAALDKQLRAHPDDTESLFLRGQLQSMGHNADYPGAFEGATRDLKAVLHTHTDHVPAMLELGGLLVNSDPTLAPAAENLFRAAQCRNGEVPLETAQRGLFFAYYYQGKMRAALEEATYLSQTWPADKGYQTLNEMIHAVLTRTGEPMTVPVHPSMATCQP